MDLIEAFIKTPPYDIALSLLIYFHKNILLMPV